MKWFALAVGVIFALIAFKADNAIHTAAYSGLACFLGIASRVLQAEEHQARNRKG